MIYIIKEKKLVQFEKSPLKVYHLSENLSIFVLCCFNSQTCNYNLALNSTGTCPRSAVGSRI
jgi:hypothetical protein